MNTENNNKIIAFNLGNRTIDAANKQNSLLGNVAVEDWLKSDDAERFADAAMRCENASGGCMQDGYCHLQGACFPTDQENLIDEQKLIATINICLNKLEQIKNARYVGE